jgi:cytidine deaminase
VPWLRRSDVKTIIDNIDWDALFAAARQAAKLSYSPYSKFSVGAAVLTDKGTYTGTNIENASFGLTICAERVAMFSAIAGEGAENLNVRAIAVVNDQDKPSSPCGACRQVIAEFTSDANIAFQGGDKLELVSIGELLSHTFRLSPSRDKK